MTLVEIPKHIDAPPHFLLWSADEMAPILIGLVVGILIEQALFLTLAGLLMTKLYRRYRNGKPDGFLLHSLYWMGLLPSHCRTLPDPYIRRYYP